MAITIDPQLEQEIEEQARVHGYHNPSAYLRDFMKQNRESQDALKQTRGWQLVEHLRGTASRHISADEIMRQTRSEV